MDPSFMQNSIETDFKSSLKLVKILFQALNVNQNPEALQAYTELEQLLGEPADSVQREIDNFRFEIPAMSFSQLVAILGTVHPVQGRHYTERNSVLHYNAQPNSYNTVDPDEAGFRARDALQVQNREATAAQLDAEFLRAKTQQEQVNRTIKNTLPDWRLMKRDANNDLRMEDSLLVFLDAKHTTLDWYIVVKNLKKIRRTHRLYRNTLSKCSSKIYRIFCSSD
jgi:hypothetical protein